MSHPKVNIYIGIVVSAMQGMLMPWFGILMGKMLFVLNGYYSIVYLPVPHVDLADVRELANKYCLHMLIAAILSLFTGFT